MKSIARTVGIAAVLVAGLAAEGCASTPAPVVTASPPNEEARWQDRVDAGWAELAEQYPDAERPDFELVRFVSLSESFTVWESCLHDAGYPQVKVADGKFVPGVVPEEQQQNFDIAMFVCQSKFAVQKSVRSFGCGDGPLPCSSGARTHLYPSFPASQRARKRDDDRTLPRGHWNTQHVPRDVSVWASRH